MKNIKLTIFALAILFLGTPHFVLAQERQLSTNGELEISPFLLDIDVAKGETTTIDIDVTNRSLLEMELNIEPRDFLPGERGQPLFVPDTEINDLTFSLAAWITSPQNKILLKSGESKTLQFKITPPVNAEEGTHYGAVLFSYGDTSFASGVGVTQSVGTILLLAYGEARSRGNNYLTTSTNLTFSNRRVDFENRFDNTGNVHVKPKGEVYVKNILGKVVSTPEINRDAANVLPKSDRTFIASWFPGTFSFGRYQAESIVTFGKERLEERDVVIVWVFPWYLLAMIGIIIAMILWFIFHGRHWHRRRIIKKHQQKNS